MHHGIFFPPFGELANPDAVVTVAKLAEDSGWDGVFLWDHMIRPPGDPQEIADTWVLLAAIAASTSRVALGPMITPLARRRPQKVARETVTLDNLSHGRLILGVGLGVNGGGELERFGECTDERLRAEILDEALGLLNELWSGAEVDHRGPHFVASGVRFLPRPEQRPRIRVWGGAVGGRRHLRPLRRAAQLDGLFPVNTNPEEFRRMLDVVHAERGSLEGYDIAAEINADAGAAIVDQYGDAGATWAMWSFGVHTKLATLESFIERGPRAAAS